MRFFTKERVVNNVVLIQIKDINKNPAQPRVLFSKEDLKDLGALLENSTYIDDSALTHPRADNIEHFYYYKAELHGRTVRLNVAKEVKHRDSGHIVIKYYLYSINDINE